MTANNKLLLYSLFLSVLILMWVPKGKAEELTLASLSTDFNSDTYALVVDVNDETQSLKSFYIDSFSAGKRTKRDALSIDVFIQKGLTVPNKSRYNFARIELENFQTDQGGIIIIDALYNYLTGKRKQYELQIAKDQSSWRLFSDGRVITTILAHANRVPIAGIVGAKDLIMQ